MATPKSWSEAKPAAMKILGDKAKLPEPKANFGKIFADFKVADKEYDAAVDVLQDKILNLQNTMSAAKNVLQQLEDKVMSSDFGLDPKDKEDKKKIDDAKKLLNDYFTEQIGNADDNIKNLDDLDKHTMGLSKYASEKCG
jgi:peptidoglycan hydrolase CwlO-like protein